MKDNIPSLKHIPFIVFTFILVLIPWTFFRAEDAGQAIYILKKIVTDFSIFDIGAYYPKRILMIGALVVFEWIQRKKEHPLCIESLPKWARYLIYIALVGAIFMFRTNYYAPFIYFQF